MNASVEFDSKSLSPTYRVIPGVPGKISAIDIAQKSGLPESVIERARTYLAGGHADVSALIQGLTKKHEEMEERARLLRDEQAAVGKKKQKIDAREIRLKEKEIELAETSRKSQKEFSAESRKLLENLVRELREGEITREKTLAVKQFIAQLDENDDALLREIDAEKDELERMVAEQSKSVKDETSRQISTDTHNVLLDKAATYALGDKVWIYSLKKEGEIIQRAKKRDAAQDSSDAPSAWIVRAGSVKLTVSEIDLKPLPARQHESPMVTVVTEESDVPQFELRLLGMRQNEALDALQKQLDLASASGFANFSVIHGKGNGVLQQAVHEYLSRYPYVAEYHFAPPEDGGAGKTYVAMKR
jgi:DNA mismatch repair protein MutS2